MAPGHLPFNLAIRIGQLARGPLGRPEDSELVVHHLLDRFTGADLTETLSRIEGTERESVSEGSAAIPVFSRDAPLRHAEEANVEIVQALSFGPAHLLGRPIGFPAKPL